MGAEARGAEAAECAVEVAIDVLSHCVIPEAGLVRRSAEGAVGSAFAAAYNVLRSRGAGSSDDPGALGTTLMTVAFDCDSRFCCWGYVGDGGLVAWSEGEARVLEGPQKGPELYSQTFGVLSGDMWQFGTLEAVDGLMLCTDGIFDALSSISPDTKAVDLCSLVGDMFLRADGQDWEAELAATFPASAEDWKTCPFADVVDDRTIVLAVSVDGVAGGSKIMASGKSAPLSLPEASALADKPLVGEREDALESGLPDADAKSCGTADLGTGDDGPSVSHDIGDTAAGAKHARDPKERSAHGNDLEIPVAGGESHGRMCRSLDGARRLLRGKRRDSKDAEHADCGVNKSGER